SINNTDTTTSKFYDDLYKNSGTAAAAQAFARAVASQGAETTEVMQTNAKAQVSSIISDYMNTYSSDYKKVLDESMKASGYSGFDDLETYIINYYKQNQIITDYVSAHFDELKVRNISYLLVKFENGDSGEGTPTEDEQKRMDAVDAEMKKGTAFPEVAKQFSEDPSTAEQGGVLGTVDVNTTTLDQAFLDAALKLKEGETSDWVYSSNFGYFRIHCNAASEDSLTAAYREQNSIPEGVEVTKEEVFNSLLSSYDTTLAGKALWEKGQELGMTFTDPGLETKLKQYMEAE
ncbi:MAG: peptidylprolyl isomerase, partial [Solobacterium sp.]|nr:peptidylprolyl isomerase [Solobacterium sp.]